MLVQLAVPTGVQTSETGGVGSQSASSIEILDGVDACVGNIRQHGKVDFEKFKAGGWKYGGKTERPARGPIPKMTQIYLGKGNVMEIITHTGLSATCQTIASVVDLGAVEADVRKGIGERFNAVNAADYKGDEGFKAMLTGFGGTLGKVMISDQNRFVIELKTKAEKQILDIMVTPRITD